ncbi:hypothetical protein E2C01_096755 [Portunus trituberculatus]|uniref:Uncharacterized protein n=1 Tax=Portunus trituberculatus TaxID=210409 RepID=A0A5B7K2V2_PORTR|nr:hypothetical protein [Portunus trituberculatus]
MSEALLQAKVQCCQDPLSLPLMTAHITNPPLIPAPPSQRPTTTYPWNSSSTWRGPASQPSKTAWRNPAAAGKLIFGRLLSQYKV